MAYITPHSPAARRGPRHLGPSAIIWILNPHNLSAFLFPPDGKITLQDVYKQLTVLNLRDKRISSLDDSLAQFQKLQYLNLSWNQIQSIADFQMPQSLFHLNLEMNFLSDIVLSQPRVFLFHPFE